MNRIARVFPRKTAASPTDALAFFREPTADDFASCIEADVSAVHISVTFTWDIPRVEDLYYAWQILGVPVMAGGPAFDDRMGDFAPGLYLKDGYIFTSRGCTKECWFCSVPRCAHGEIRELPVVDGWNILDDNILGTSEAHFRAVCEMLKRQEHYAVFTGGLEPALLQQWHADLLREVKPKRIYTAYDTKDDLEPLVEMGEKLRSAGSSPPEKSFHVLLCACRVRRGQLRGRGKALDTDHAGGLCAVCDAFPRRRRADKRRLAALSARMVQTDHHWAKV